MDTKLNAKSRAIYHPAFTFPFTYLIYIYTFLRGAVFQNSNSHPNKHGFFFFLIQHSSVLKSRNVTLYHSTFQEASRHLGQQNRDLHFCLK